MHHVFISYSRRQNDQVTAVFEELGRIGVPAWIDRSDIPQGVPWERQLRRAIRESDLVTYFVSDDWLTSPACAAEREIVNEFGKPTVLVRVASERFTPSESAAVIASAYRQLPQAVSELTDLESAAASWAESGMPKKLLARGRDVKRFRRLTADRDTGTETAHRFVIASHRANRLRIIDRIAGFLVVSLALGVIRLAPQVAERAAQARSDLVASLDQYASVRAASLQGPYQALEAALALPSDDDGRMDSGYYVSVLLDATSVDVPSEHGPDNGAVFSDFVFRVRPGSSQSTSLGMRAELGSDGSGVLLTDSKTNHLLARVTVPGAPFGVSFSPDGHTLAVLGDTAVTLVDPRRGRVWRTLEGADLTGCDQIGWSSDGRRIAVKSTSAGVATAWQVLSDTQVLADTGLWIMDSTTLGSTGDVAFLGRDGSLALVQAAGSGQVDVIQDVLPNGVAYAIAGDSAGNDVYVAEVQDDGDQELYAVDLTKRKATPVTLPDGCPPSAIAMNPADDSAVIVACGSRIVSVTPVGRVLSDVTTGVEGISAITVASDGTLFAGASGGGGVFAFTPDFQEQGWEGAAVAGAGKAAVGSCPGGTPLKLRAVPGRQAVYSAGEGTGRGLCARVVEVEDGKWVMGTPPVTDESANQARGLAVSPDGSLAAFGLSDGTVQLLSASDSSVGWRWNEQLGEIRGVEFSPGSSNLVIGTRDGLITRVPAVADRLHGRALRERAAQMLDRARHLGLWE